MPKTLKLRTAPTLNFNNLLRIDRENLALYDVVAMQSGVEAIGHGCQADQKTLQQMAALGNQRTNGVRMRFGHPGASDNADGKKLGLANNFRVTGDELRHDVRFLEAAQDSPVFARDPIEYIFRMAETASEELAESAVVKADLVWTFADGREFGVYDDKGMREAAITRDEADGRPVDALTPLPVIRPKIWPFVDFVSEGALTHDGLFSAEVLESMFSGTSNLYAQQVFDLLDEWRDDYGIALKDVPGKVDHVLKQYLYTRGSSMPKSTNPILPRVPAPALGFSAEAVLAAAANEPVGNEDQTLPVETTPESDALVAAEQSAAATSEQLQPPPTPPEASTPSEPLEASVPLAEYEALQARVVSLEALVKRVIALSVANTDNIERLFSEVRRIDGEPVQTRSVPRARAMQMQAGLTPPASLSRQTPGAITGATTSPAFNFDDNPEQATLAAALERQAALIDHR